MSSHKPPGLDCWIIFNSRKSNWIMTTEIFLRNGSYKSFFHQLIELNWKSIISIYAPILVQLYTNINAHAHPPKWKNWISNNKMTRIIFHEFWLTDSKSREPTGKFLFSLFSFIIFIFVCDTKTFSNEESSIFHSVTMIIKSLIFHGN